MASSPSGNLPLHKAKRVFKGVSSLLLLPAPSADPGETWQSTAHRHVGPRAQPLLLLQPCMTQAHLTNRWTPPSPGFEMGMFLLLPPKGAMLQWWGCAGRSLGRGSPQLPAARAPTPCYLLAPIPLPLEPLLRRTSPGDAAMREGSRYRLLPWHCQPHRVWGGSEPPLPEQRLQPPLLHFCPYGFPPSMGFRPPVLQQPLLCWCMGRGVGGSHSWLPATVHTRQRHPVASIKDARWEARRKQGAAMLYFYNSQQNGQLESKLNADPQLCPKPPSQLKRQ